ncbi:MAG: hypothetical protein AB1555_18455 [Nitrospirota bacterium]
MRRRRLYSPIIAVCLVGLWATFAYAVATNVKVVGAGGNPMAKAKVKVTLNDGSTTRGVTDASGQVTLDVDPKNVKETEVEDENGNRRRLAGAWFLTDDTVVLNFMNMASIAAVGGAAMGARAGWIGNTEVVFGVGGVTSFGGGNDGRSTSIFNDTTGSGGALSGTSFNLQFRTFPFAFNGIRVGGFVEYDQFFGADASGGIGVHHIVGGPSNDTKFTRRANRAFGFGLTQVVPLIDGVSVDFIQGIAFLQQTIEGESDEAKGGGTLVKTRSSTTNVVPKLGLSLEYQLPGFPVSIRLASEFIYMPSVGANTTSGFTGSRYAFSAEGTWLANTTLGLVVPLSQLLGTLH